MPDLDAVCFALWATAPLYLAARRAQKPPRQRALPRGTYALCLAAAALWVGRQEHLGTALATATAAVAAMASVMVLLVAARPRLAGLLALVAPGIATILAVYAGGGHGS